MSEAQFSDRVRKADRWSKVVALLVAMVAFTVSLWLTEAAHLSSIVAAAAGIGTRFFIPYQVNLSEPVDERVSIKEHPATGNFHHGAVGVALVVGAAVTTAVMVVEMDSSMALWLGGAVTGLLFILLTSLMPRI